MMNRTAESLFWIGRYLERAENHARLIDVHYHSRQVLTDHSENCVWERLIKAIGDIQLFRECFKEANETTALQFLTFEPKNPNSLLSCVYQTRNNVRALRQLLPSELWESINGFYLWLKDQDIGRMMMSSPFLFYQKTREWLSQIRGTADSTMVRDLVWNFIQAGKFFERTDNLLRNLHSYLDVTKDLQKANYISLMVLLKSNNAYEAYRRLNADNVSLTNVIEFLISDPSFPHAVKYALSSLEDQLLNINQQDDHFELLAKRAINDVAEIQVLLANFQSKKDRVIGLPMIQGMLALINRIGLEISNTFFQEEFVEA